MLATKFQKKANASEEDKFYILKPVLTAVKFNGSDWDLKTIKKWFKKNYSKISVTPKLTTDEIIQDKDGDIQFQLVFVGKVYGTPKYETMIQAEDDVEYVYNFYQFENKDEKQLPILKKYIDKL